MSRYLNLFLDADISDRHDQEKYTRCLDVALAEERVTVDDVIGIGEQGTGSNLDLYIVHRDAVAVACERGIFNKRIEVRRLSRIAPIVRLRGTQEGYKGSELTITGHDADGEVLFKITWGLAGPDWVEPLVLRQRDHLFRLISRAMDEAGQRGPITGSPAPLSSSRPPMVGGPSPAHALLPPDIASRMARYGRYRVDRYSADEPDPLDPAWEPIIPSELETSARADPKSYIDALAETIGPIGDWAAYGAAEFALDVGDHDLDDPSYRRLFVDGLMTRRSAGVPWPMLNSFDQAYWTGEHPNEPWQPERTPPPRAEAVIEPLGVGEERLIARVSSGPDPKLIYATRPTADRYVIVIQHPQDDGLPTRGEMSAADNLYDAYIGIGMHQHALPHFWNDPEFEPFCRHLWPRL